jgi:hypothetical protein
LDELKRPANWNPAGYTYLAEIPAALTFTFQAIHGAACVYSGQVTRAITLTRARLVGSFRGDADLLYKQHELIGWPHSFNQRSNLAWNYLLGLFGKWAWLNELFGSKEEYEAALQAYYLGLHIQELGDVIATGQESVFEKGFHQQLVPAHSLFHDSEGNMRAYRMLIHNPSEVRAIWRSMGLSDGQMAGAWEKWLNTSCRLFSNSNHMPDLKQFPHFHLFDDIRPETNKEG